VVAAIAATAAAASSLVPVLNLIVPSQVQMAFTWIGETAVTDENSTIAAGGARASGRLMRRRELGVGRLRRIVSP
jgi:hypothetical protein